MMKIRMTIAWSSLGRKISKIRAWLDERPAGSRHPVCHHNVICHFLFFSQKYPFFLQKCSFLLQKYIFFFFRNILFFFRNILSKWLPPQPNLLFSFFLFFLSHFSYICYLQFSCLCSVLVVFRKSWLDFQSTLREHSERTRRALNSHSGHTQRTPREHTFVLYDIIESSKLKLSRGSFLWLSN